MGVLIVFSRISLSLFLLLSLLVVFKVSYDLILCYFVTPRRIKKVMQRQGVDGPKPRLLTGNITDVDNFLSISTAKDMDYISHDIVPRLMPQYVAWSKQYGKRFISWNGIEPRLCITESDMIKELLTKHSNKVGKSWLQREGTKHFIGRGLLMANGHDWHYQRHVAAPAFMGEKLKSYGRLMVECTENMLTSLDHRVGSAKTEIEIGEYMTRLTADIISRTEFDSSYEIGKLIFDRLKVLQSLCAQATRHLCLPGSRFFPGKYNRRIKSLKGEVESLLMEIIESRKSRLEMGKSYGNDLLGVLLNEMRTKGSSSSSNTKNLQLIMDECKTFFFAGHETSSLLLTWTIMLLATNPVWQEKVRAEVRQVCNGQTPSLEHLSKLTTLNMVINESLRLYPPATLLPRMAFEDFKLGDLDIPKGLAIWIPVLAIHHSEELWGKDANEFNPDRFGSKPFSAGRLFIPFAAGPRNCVGQSYALMEAKIILAMFITRFNFTISDSYRHAPVIVLTIKPRYGVQVYLNPIN